MFDMKVRQNIYQDKKNVNFTLEQVMNAQRGIRGIALLFL
jgi:hypothetical protein